MELATIEVPLPVRPEEHGLRLDVYISRRLARLSRHKAASIIYAGNVRSSVEGSRLKPSRRVQGGECIWVQRPKLAESSPDDVQLPVIYEDASVLAVNKPGDVVVHPTASAYHRTVIRILRTRRNEHRLDLAHRIDKETSGLLLLGRSVEASSHLKKQFAERRVKKSYLALVRGRPVQNRFLISAPMRRLDDGISKVEMSIGGPGAQPAETEIEVIASGPDAALVHARPRTGRQHQIRLHLAHVGHPIVGDKLYLGGEAYFLEAVNQRKSDAELIQDLGHTRQALHAFSLTMTHPKRGEPMTLFAPLADDLRERALSLGLTPDFERLPAACGLPQAGAEAA